MHIRARQGQDIEFDADDHVIVRIQGYQWRLARPASGTAILSGAWTRSLRYWGGRPIKGDVWVGKTHHTLEVEPRG